MAVERMSEDRIRLEKVFIIMQSGWKMGMFFEWRETWEIYGIWRLESCHRCF